MSRPSSGSRISHTELVRTLAYNPETGVWVWLVQRQGYGPGVFPGDVAGAVNASGYRHIGINGRLYSAHTLAWFYMTGSWPEQLVDHKDRVKTNNSWRNLRLSDHSRNGMNAGVRSRNKSGATGVFHRKKTANWEASIRVSGKRIYLGKFKTFDEAVQARRVAEIGHFGEFSPNVQKENP